VGHNLVPHVEFMLVASAVFKDNPGVGLLYQYPEAVSFLLNRKALI
jgi:hypothetical protein